MTSVAPLKAWKPNRCRRNPCEMTAMRKISFILMLLGFIAMPPAALAEDVVCFESRKGASEVTQRKINEQLPNVKCSPKTGGVLWWGDPYDGTVPMGRQPVDADYSKGKALVKPRSDKLALMPLCGVACHNGVIPPTFPKDKNPRLLTMHQDIIPDSTKLAHGRGAVWCLDCHHPTQRNKLIDNFGKPISFDQPQLLCGKCHGPILRDWRDGIHGKRIGEWASSGTKRWFVCTECHNPHDVQQADRNSGFAQLAPERAPELPKGMKTADHERAHHGTGKQKGSITQ